MESLLNNFYCPKADTPKLISFEGIEGSGKSTQIERFENYLKEKNIKYSRYREPGGTAFGEKLREAILSSTVPLANMAEAMLFASARSQLLFEKVNPDLESGKVVVLDRYIDSSIAYQGHARGLGAKTILELHQAEPLNKLPNITFYLRIDADTSLSRQDQRGNSKDYFEKEKRPFYQKLIDGYDESAQLFPKRFCVIDGSRKMDEVTADILKAFEGYHYE